MSLASKKLAKGMPMAKSLLAPFGLLKSFHVIITVVNWIMMQQLTPRSLLYVDREYMLTRLCDAYRLR